MPVPFLDLTRQYATLQEETDRAVAEVMASQRFILGPAVERLERELAEHTGVPHAIACASGTDALLLALKALDLEPGDEVIVPAFTFFATAGAVWNAGLTPVFADVDPATLNLTPEAVAERLSDRTRAVVVVHLYGLMAPMAELLALGREHGVAVIEDAAQSLGARQRVDGEWRRAGSIGTMGCFSFFPTKVLGGAGDGGMVVTSQETLADRVAKLRVHGGRQMYHHQFVGTNSRLDALQAAVLSVKVPHLDGWLEARRRIAARYDAALGGLASKVEVLPIPEGNEHAYGVYTIRAAERDGLREHLTGRGIGCSVYYPVPLHLQECFGSLGYRLGDLPVSEQAGEEVLSLPLFPELREEEVEEVVGAIAGFYDGAVD